MNCYQTYKEKATQLVSEMTLEEKVFQTLYNAPAIERLGIKSYNWWNEALHENMLTTKSINRN